MVKVEVIEKFTLKDFDELQNIKRRSIDVKGSLFVGDTFDCSKEMADYLTGNNPLGKVVVRIVEIEPEFEEKLIYLGDESTPPQYEKVEKPKKKTSKKKKN